MKQKMRLIIQKEFIPKIKVLFTEYRNCKLIYKRLLIEPLIEKIVVTEKYFEVYYFKEFEPIFQLPNPIIKRDIFKKRVK